MQQGSNMPDIAIPIVFPDYLIAVNTPKTRISIPDLFTGMIFEDKSGELYLEYFNNPKGNRRKIITLQIKLAPGAFEKINKACLPEAEVK